MRSLLCFLGGFLFLVFIAFHLGLRINFTKSMPLGVYYLKNKAPKREDIVAVCLPKEIAQEGLRQHYLFHGQCPENSVPVLKQLIAIPGDFVQLSLQGILVNHTFYEAKQLTYDSHHKKIKTWLKPPIFSVVNQYWLYGNYNKNRSWDSRYWGGVNREDILGVYSPIWAADLPDESKSPTHSSGESSLQKNSAPHQSTPAGFFTSILAKAKIS